MTTSPLFARSVSMCLAILLAGCGSQATSALPHVTPAVAKHSPRQRTSRIFHAEVRVRGLVARLVNGYSTSQLGGVRLLFASPGLGNGMVSQLAAWRDEGVEGLVAAPVSLVPLGPNRYAVTIEFKSDPRAIPTYDLYTVIPSKHGLLFSAPTSGLHGTAARHANWAVTRSAHYRIFHSPYELLGADRHYLADLEYERSVFVKKFGVQPPTMTNYYYYPQQSLMRSFTGGVCGTTAEFVGCTLTKPQPPEIHTSEWPSYHEPVHVFQIAMEPKRYVAPEFISEGMAVALEDRELDPLLSDYCSDLTYVPLDDCAANAIAGVHPEKLLSDHGFSSGNLSTSYLMAGSFVKYLILTYGYHKFGRFYYILADRPGDQVRDYNVATGRVYGTTTASLLDAWRTALCTGGRC